MTNHPTRATAPATILDQTDGGRRACPPATAEQVQTFRVMQRLSSGGHRIVMDSAGYYGKARSHRQATAVANVPSDRIVIGVFRTYAPNGLGEVVDLPAWIVT
jgi:hypothetical protein